MHQFTPKLVKSLNAWPFPLVDKARSVHQDVAPVGDNLSIVLNLDLPLTFIFMPMARDDSMVELDVLAKLVLFAEVHKILVNVW